MLASAMNIIDPNLYSNLIEVTHGHVRRHKMTYTNTIGVRIGVSAICVYI